MKTKRTMRHKPSPKQKLTHWYVAGGIALAVLVGIGLFFYLNLGPSTDSKAAAPDFYSVDNGFWSDGPTWFGGFAPATTDIASDIEIFEFVTRVGDLSYKSGSNNTLIITDTLLIDGNLTMGNKSNITVNDGGVLIVTGDFTADNKIVVGNGGVIAIGGNMTFPTNTQDTYDGSGGDLFVVGTISGNGDASSTAQDATSFQSAYPNIYNILQGGSGPLPIELTYFKVKAAAKTVLVEWETSTEINNDFFTVERSADGRTFESIITINGAGNSQQSRIYSYTDPYPLDGVSYYRLKQTDFDGKYERFKTVAVSRQATNAADPTPVIHSVAPNPFDISFSVAYEVPTAGPVRIQLMDLNGTTITSEIIEAASGRNQYQFEQGGQLKSGIYLLMLTSDQHTSKTMRVVKR